MGLMALVERIAGRGDGSVRWFRSGQMTVELAVAFPVLVVVAVVAVNAMGFFAECASFDRLACQTVRVHATAPAYGQSSTAGCALVQAELESAFDRPNENVSVSCGATGFDLVRYDMTLEYSPTLFGLGLRSEVFGVALPKLRHEVSYVIDPYKPGVIV